MSCHLHSPLKAFSTDVAAMCLDGKMGATNVVAEGGWVRELCRADVADARLSPIRHRLLHSRVQNVLNYFTASNTFSRSASTSSLTHHDHLSLTAETV